jgi:predicted N-acetyltransferase YhbS
MNETPTYPKHFTVRGDKTLLVGPLLVEDQAAVLRLIKRLPADERNFFWDDLTDQRVFNELIAAVKSGRTISLVARAGNEIIALWTLTFSSHGWTRHLGTIWGFIEPSWRRSGLGSYMIRELLTHAAQNDVERVVLELVKPQKGPLKYFSKIGFTVAATLQDWAKDGAGRHHDLVVISMKLEPAWHKMDELLSRYDSTEGS